MKHILAVCTANICRSPIAEGLLARALPEHQVQSAGLAALIGFPADPVAVTVAATQGVDLKPHRARQLAAWMCERADLILVMDQTHRLALEERFPLARGKVFRLGHYGDFDVADPYRMSVEAFESASAAIARGVDEWALRIRRLR